MQLVLILLVAFAILELALYTPIWRWRKHLAPILLVAEVVSYIRLLPAWLNLASVLIVLVGLYRLINLSRILKQRLQPDYLFASSRRTSCWLIAYQLLMLLMAWLVRQLGIGVAFWLDVLAGVQLVVGGWLYLLTRRHIIKSTPTGGLLAISEKDLPSLTVAIPARNETSELEECLNSLVASDYPKLEIIVLDDCSQNKRTPEVIRSFAHSGVIFMAGEEPPTHWLAKNYAYKQLAAKANGELILFCGTDVRFAPGSLRRMVELMLARHKQMLCLLPHNLLSQQAWLKPLLIQPARYAWELTPPRKWWGRPPVLSTCWLIKAEALRSAGGFDAVSRKIIPESYFARETAANGDGYSFLQATKLLNVTSAKSFTEQRATAVRTRYPQLHRRLELVPLVGLAELYIQIWPILAIIIGILTARWPLVIIAACGLVFDVVLFAGIVKLTYQHRLLNSLWALPLAAAYDIALLNYSMWRYEFSEVLWKGRNVCLPLMQLYPAITSDSAQKP